MEDLQPLCGNCAWYAEIEIPEEKRKEVSPRGFCHYNPPQVFPLPQQRQSSLALAQGQQAPGTTQMVPMMMRPVVEATEGICGRYRASYDMMQKVEAHMGTQDKEHCDGAGGCGGCQDEGAKCACKE